MSTVWPILYAALCILIPAVPLALELAQPTPSNDLPQWMFRLLIDHRRTRTRIICRVYIAVVTLLFVAAIVHVFHVWEVL